MKCLITGGCGFIGKHLANYILRKSPNSQVILFDNMSRVNNDFLLEESPDRLFVVKGDVSNIQELFDMGHEGIDAIFHLAAQSNVTSGTETEYALSNITGTDNVLKYGHVSGVKSFIFTSSREVYGEQEILPVRENAPLTPKNLYGISKLSGEIFCNYMRAISNMSINIFRLSNVYGEGDTNRVIPEWIERALKNEALTIYGSEKILDFVHISRVLEVITAPLHGRGMISTPMNVGSGIGTSLENLARLIIRLTNSKSEIIMVDERDTEVNSYIANIERMLPVIGYKSDSDPLFGLESVINEKNS